MSDPTTALFNDQNAAFMHWLVASRSAEINPKVALTDLRSIGAGRGVVALEALEDDTLIFRLPRENALSLETSTLGSLLAPGELASLDPWLALILVLIYETRPESPWKPYIDLFPTEFNSLMFWSPAELSLLRGSAVLDKIGREDAEDLFKTKVLPVIQTNESVFLTTALANVPAGSTFAAHFLSTAHRMASVIMSYSFDLVVPGAASSNPDASDSEDEDEEKLHYKAMIPLADMLNADATLNNCRLFETPTGLEMKTILPVPAGAELYNDYGPLPRSDLLRRYGYTTANYTPYDVVEVSSLLIVNTAAGATLAPAEKQARVDYLLDEDILEDSFDLEAAAPADIPDEVLVIVNTVLLTPDDFQRYKAANKLPKAKLTEASAEVLGAVLEARLREYPTTLEEDQRLLVGESLKGRERAAVEVRLGEKQILVAAYKELNRRVQEKKRPAGEDGDEEERGSKRSRN